jgi:carboxyl-terminal processing protease
MGPDTAPSSIAQTAPKPGTGPSGPGRGRKWLLLTAVTAALGVGGALGLAIGASSASGPGMASSSTRDNTLRQLELYADVLARVRSDYVVPTEDAKLIEASINGMLQSLDPHSGYMNPKALEAMQVSTRGQYGGLGLEVTSEEGAVRVITPMDGSPGARAGLKAGDRLIAIDGVSILGLPLDEAVARMRGDPGTTIGVTVAREGQEPFVVQVTREVIVLRPVTHRVEGDIGYIRLSTFVNENTGAALEAALDDIERQLGGRLKGVVIDLRNNGGGLLTEAIRVTDTFIDRGEIVSTRGRRPEDTERFYGQAGQRMRNVPIAVLINEGSASASEIVAGALQDYGRVTVVGMASFGKGSVQTVIPLNNGRDGALRLTTSKYYTPGGRSIQGSGIEPDIEIAAARVTLEEVRRRQAIFAGEESLPNALDNETNAHRRAPHMPADMPPENWPQADDYQLKRTLELINNGTIGLRPVARAQTAAAAEPAPAARPN